MARDLGVSPALADKYLYGARSIDRLFAAVIASDLRAKDHDAVARWIAPGDAVLADVTPDEAEQALQEYDCADADEDRTQAGLGRKPLRQLTLPELDAYLIMVAREAYRATRAMGALRLERAGREAR